VSYPYLGMGIAFTEISEENATNLRKRVATLSHACVVMGPGITASLPAAGLHNAIPLISDPAAAIQTIVEFFETRQILMQEDFLRLLKKSQK
jgi:hypothetical protein